MYLASVKQARAIDYDTINKYKTPGILLMENAGAAVANEAFRGADMAYTVICGSGNNGGDGSVAARHLFARGADVVLALIYPAAKLKGDALIAYKTAVSFGVPVIHGICSELLSRLEKSDVIIDAVLGIGAKGAPKAEAESAIRLINNASATVISADVPSGINSDNGQAEGVAVKADTTVTFGIAKTGQFIYPARSYAGEIKVVNIGFSPEAVKNANINIQTITDYKFPKINDSDYKGSRGKVLVVAGCFKYSGAAYMSSASALRAGSGIVTLACPKSISDYNESFCPELIRVACPDSDGYFSPDAAEFIRNIKDDCNSVVLGCGIGVTDGTKKVVKSIISDYNGKLVLDADGINCISPNTLKDKKCDMIITPHIGEMARFLDISTKEVSDNMIKIAKTVAYEYNVVVVLKSATTVIADPTGTVYINTYGSCGMATAGSGDVLAGIIGGFCAQGMSAFESAVNGVAVHAISGGIVAKSLGTHYMTATDIIKGISMLETKGKAYNGQ